MDLLNLFLNLTKNPFMANVLLLFYVFYLFHLYCMFILCLIMHHMHRIYFVFYLCNTLVHYCCFKVLYK